eukprot:5497111-Amphidinium_carterae.1
MEKLVGHSTFLMLIQRSSLSTLSACYSFSRKNYLKVVPLWPSVVRELRMLDGILPLLHRDLRCPWSEQVVMVDASPEGYGVVERQCPLQLVQRGGR